MGRFVVGLTGGIGSGKSAVSARFAERGIVIADSDIVSRQILEPGEPIHHEVVARFGQDVLLPDGQIDRAGLRKIIFADPAERKWLESQTHPQIMRTLRDILANAASPFSVLVLSAGTGRSPLMNVMLVVDVEPALQISRVTVRDNSSTDQIKAIMAAQPSREDRLSWADDVIENNGSLSELWAQTDILYGKYLSLAGEIQ